MKSDEDWMIEYQNGSEDAFNHLYFKYSGNVYSYISKRININHRDDLYQKVWRHLHEKKDLYKNTPFAPWFFMLIRNLVIDEYRLLGRKNKTEFNDVFLENSKSDTSYDSDLDEILNKLDNQTADLVRKYYLEGSSYKDLELETGLSQTNLRKRLSRAIKSLRGKYEE